MIKFENNPVKHPISISSKFDYRIHPVYGYYHHHSGNDLRSSNGVVGDPLISVADGVVALAKVNGGGVNSGYGYYIIIDHGGWCTLYAHQMALDVSLGDNISAGQQIGRMGMTGTATGPHCHFAVYNHSYTSDFFLDDENGVDMHAVDPELYYVYPELTWQEMIARCADEPEGWITTLEALLEFANHSSNLGDLERVKYIDQLVEKLYLLDPNK